MALALLKEISAAEQQAEQIETEAQQKARDIIAAAKKEAAMVLQKTEEQAEQDARGVIRAAEEMAALDINERKATIQKQCLEIKELSGRKLKDAMDLIVGRIVTNSDR